VKRALRALLEDRAAFIGSAGAVALKHIHTTVGILVGIPSNRGEGIISEAKSGAFVHKIRHYFRMFQLLGKYLNFLPKGVLARMYSRKSLIVY